MWVGGGVSHARCVWVASGHKAVSVGDGLSQGQCGWVTGGHRDSADGCRWFTGELWVGGGVSQG